MREELICPTCHNCDTRTRLQLCNGRKGSFNYCFRKVGSIDGLEKTITPFNEIDDIFRNEDMYIQSLVKSSLHLDKDRDYGNEYTCLMFGRFKGPYFIHPVGFVTKLGGEHE